jgi:hypothetical protein
VDLGGSSAVAFSACLEPSARLLAVRLQQGFAASGERPPQRIQQAVVLGF